MRVGIATDHAGFGFKENLASELRDLGHDVVDFGAKSLSPGDDYPDYVVPLAEAVRSGDVQRGLAICGSGVGASVAANKVHGIRAGPCHDMYSAHQGVEHDDMNILVLGAGHRTGTREGTCRGLPRCAVYVRPAAYSPA